MADVKTEYRDGFLRCDFSHAARYTVDRRPVDLASGDLHLMVASGPGQSVSSAQLGRNQAPGHSTFMSS